MAESFRQGGKSGAFFYFSHDKKLIIKTLTKGEAKALVAMLPDLARHVMDTRRKDQYSSSGDKKQGSSEAGNFHLSF